MRQTHQRDGGSGAVDDASRLASHPAVQEEGKPPCPRLAHSGEAVGPADQEALAQEKRHINTSIQRVVVVSDRKQEHQPIMKLRQRSAFPPNYIHSLDSTHMMMTASACKEAGELSALSRVSALGTCA